MSNANPIYSVWKEIGGCSFADFYSVWSIQQFRGGGKWVSKTLRCPVLGDTEVWDRFPQLLLMVIYYGSEK